MTQHDNPVHELLAEVTAGLARLPGTARALIAKPGWLTRAWVEGARGPYLTPARLYLASALVFFVVWPWWSDWGLVRYWLTTAPRDFAQGYNSGSGATVLKETGAAPGVVAFLVDHLEGVVLLVLLPLFTAILRETARPRIGWSESTVFALDYHSFLFLFFTAMIPVMAVSAGMGRWVLQIAAAAYLVVALRRAFDRSWGRCLWQATQIAVGYIVTASVLALLIGFLFSAS